MSYRTFFGKRDADREDTSRLINYYYELDAVRSFKFNTKEDAPFLAVGVKGSGKTAICRWIEDKYSDDSIVWKLKQTDGWEVNTESYNTPHIKSVIVHQFLRHIYNEIVRNPEAFSEDARSSLPSKMRQIAQKVGWLLEELPVKTSAGPFEIEVDVGSLLSKPLSELNKMTIDDYLEILSLCLRETRAYILLDDIDSIFPGAANNLRFIEGLIDAAAEINSVFESLLHFLVFMKADMFSKYYRFGEGYDRYAEEMFINLRWDENDLIEMMSKRIAVATNTEYGELPHWRIWQHAFSGKTKKDINDIQSYMIRLSNSGPRDLIHLGNLAKAYAGERRIQFEDLIHEEVTYSGNKLQLLNRDYGSPHEDIASLLFKVFQGQPAIYEEGQLEFKIQTEVLADKELMKSDLGNIEFLRPSDAKLIMEHLFDYGFIGYRTSRDALFRYMMDSDVKPGALLFDAVQHRIHPAYETHLGLDDEL